MEPVLVSLSDLYSEDDKILVCNSRYSSYPAYTSTDYLIYQLLVIRREYGQTLGLGLVDKNRTIDNY